MKMQFFDLTKVLKVLFVVFLFLPFQGFQLSAQTCPGIATLSSTSDYINLTGSDLCEEWTLDISDIGFGSSDEAISYFKMNRDNISKYSVNWAEQQVTLTIMLMYKPQWTVVEWKEYFQNNTMRH